MSRSWWWFAIVLGAQSVCSVALAWVNMTVRGDAVVVELRRDGTAQVSHELMLSVRGGPLERFELNGVDADAQPIGEASLVRAKVGEPVGPARPMKVERDGDALRFSFPYGPGIRTGRYLVRFSYLTDLKQQTRLRRVQDQAELLWQTPIFEDGVDSLKVTFRVPRGTFPPRLAGTSPTMGAAASLFALDDGVFLAELSRDAQVDQLMLTRPHVARGERVDWRVQVDAAVFGMAPVAADGPVETRAAPVKRRPAPPWGEGLALMLAGGFFAGLVWVKHRWGAVRPLLRLAPSLRGLLVWAAMSGSLAAAVLIERPTLAAVLLVVALLLTVTLAPLEGSKPRGPGRWRALKGSDLKQVQAESVKLPWLEISCLRGLLLFTLLVAALVVVALRNLAASPYHSAMALVYAAAWLPLFCSLGQEDSLEQARALYGLRRRLARASIHSRLIGRVSEGASGVDEVRLSVEIEGALPGFVGLEVGLEHWQGWFRRVASWVVIVRVREGSPSCAALPAEAISGRGRHKDERVALFRPPLPIAHLAFERVLELHERLRRDEAPGRAMTAQARPRAYGQPVRSPSMGA